MKLGRIVIFACLVAGVVSAQSSVEVLVLDGNSRPVPNARVEIRAGEAAVLAAETDSAGHAVFPKVTPAHYTISAAKTGFQTVTKSDVAVSAGTSVELTLLPPLDQHEHVEVTDKVLPVEQGSSAPATLSTKAAKELPGRPATVADALPLIPGVVRTPNGDLQISGTGEHRSSLIVNSADVTDPATGQFGLTVPIDSVQTLEVFQTPFLAEYGRFSAGLVSVETRRGGEEWKWELNDPFPDFRIRSYHLRGLRDASPRLNVEGPIVRGKLYFSEGLEYEVRNTENHTLPFPYNQTRKAGFNSFAQVDWVASPHNLMTGTLHFAPQRMEYVNLDFFNPQPTVPDASTHNYTGTIGDKLSLWGGLLESTFSVTRFDVGVWGQGGQDLNIAPTGRTGNYFEQQSREAWRFGGSPSYTFAPVNRWGSHSFKIGSYIAHSTDDGQVLNHPVNIFGAPNQLLERITFFGGRPFEMDDTEYAFFGQDHWSITPHLAADLGIRTESQVVSQSFRVAPRAGLAWVPFPHTGTVIRGGFGFFFDRVPLNVYAFNHYPKQIVTMYGPDGGITAGPYFYLNALTVVNTHQPFVSHGMNPGNFSPRTATGSIQIEQPVTQLLRLRFSYLRSISDGLVTLIPQAPDPETMVGAYDLTGSGDARYRQLELTARLRLSETRHVFFSYVRNRAHGELNDFANYLGSFPLALIRTNNYGRLPGDLPNRFLAWGVIPLPLGFQIAPILEYRDGLPYSDLNAAQQYVGIPLHNRYPNFVSLDSRFSKDIKVNPKYTVRLSLASYNLANHFNPEAIHSNIADPWYGTFFGSRGRRFTADFDVLF